MPDPTLIEIRAFCKANSDSQRAADCMRYFKTGPGEYGHGDVFLGIETPVLRKALSLFKSASLDTMAGLLQTGYHEERALALMLMVHRFQRGSPEIQKRIVDCYLGNIDRINNWDLVDLSAHKILGAYFFNRSNDNDFLIKLASSPSLWERRIAIISTSFFIRQDCFEMVFRIADILLNDPEDLIRKAVGWMLRETGKRNMAAEVDFLDTRYKTMPRTMLRYAIERFEEPLRQRYLKGLV